MWVLLLNHSTICKTLDRFLGHLSQSQDCRHLPNGKTLDFRDRQTPALPLVQLSCHSLEMPFTCTFQSFIHCTCIYCLLCTRAGRWGTLRSDRWRSWGNMEPQPRTQPGLGKAPRVTEKLRTKGRRGFSQAKRRPKQRIHTVGVALQAER